jgi:hypothetical protein
VSSSRGTFATPVVLVELLQRHLMQILEKSSITGTYSGTGQILRSPDFGEFSRFWRIFYSKKKSVILDKFTVYAN